MRALPWIAVSLLTLSCSSPVKNVVADVAGKSVTSQQFTDRYKKYLATTNQRDNILLRQQVLNNMVNEVLIYQDVSKRGLDSDSEYIRTMDDIKNQELLSAYARHVVSDTAIIPESKLHDEFRSYNTKFTARYLYSRSEKGARELKSRISRGATFEGLAKETFEDPGLANNGGSLGTFGWGEMESALEEAVFGMNAGEISEPVRLSMGYAIIRLEHRVENRFKTETDYLKVREKLWRRVLERDAERIGREEVERIEKEIAPQFDEGTVKEVFANWHNIISDSATPQIELVHSMPDISNKVLVRFTTGQWNVSDFLKKVDKTSDRQRRRVRMPEDVKNITVGLATRDVVLERSRSLGLSKDEKLIEATDQKREAFLLKRWLSLMADSANQTAWPEDSLRKKYNETRSERAYPPEVNVAEILVRSRREADSLLRIAKSRKDFASLARTNSIRQWAAKRGGELGFGTEARFGILGKKFFDARVGSIIGPEKVDPYFGIFKILDRKNGRQMTFEEAKDGITSELNQKRKLESRQNAVAHLREGVNVNINNAVLENIVLN